MSKTTFLEYYKTVLEKVSFDESLLTKEYKKAKHFLHPAERKHLKKWMEKKGLRQKTREYGLMNSNLKVRNDENSANITLV